MSEENKEANNKPTSVIVALASGQIVGPVLLLARDIDGVYIQVSMPKKLKSGRAAEVDIARFVPYSSLLFMDILPDEGETDDAGTQG